MCSFARMTAVPPFHTGRVLIDVQAGLELLDMPFTLSQRAGFVGQVCVCMRTRALSAHPRPPRPPAQLISYCNDCGV